VANAFLCGSDFDLRTAKPVVGNIEHAAENVFELRLECVIHIGRHLLLARVTVEAPWMYPANKSPPKDEMAGRERGFCVIERPGHRHP